MIEFKPITATLVKRYKRFLADVILEDGSETTIHVANTGAMTGCAEPNSRILCSESNNLKRKYPLSWEFTQWHQHYICVNTQRANNLVEEALQQKLLPELAEITAIQREVRYGSENSKIDFLLTDTKNNPVYVEVKSVTLLEDNQGYFPDTVTTRGQKHLRELIQIAQQGGKAVLLFAVLHTGIESVKPAAHKDSTYAQLLLEAHQAGVTILAYKMQVNCQNSSISFQLNHAIEVILFE